MAVIMTIQRSEVTGELFVYAHYEDGEEQLLDYAPGSADSVEPLTEKIACALRELLVAEQWEPGE